MTTHRSTPIKSSASGDVMIGTVAAAKMLGLCRSSINYAVKRKLLKPDHTTPSGGHMRFYPKTIERYRALREGRIASRDPRTRAAEDQARAVRLDLLRRLAVEQAAGKEAREVCRIALTELRQIMPDMCLAVVVQLDPTDADPLHCTPLASDGVTEDLVERVGRVGRTTQFAFREVLKSGETLRCDDTQITTLAIASQVFIEELGIRSYCVLPIKAHARTIGLLIVHSTRVNAFAGVIQPFLEHVADLLAVAIISHHRVSKLRDYLKHAGDFMTRGVEEYVAGGVATHTRLEQMLVSLARAYCEATNAYTVICTAGPPAPGMVWDERVRKVAEDASRTQLMTIQRWKTTEGPVTCVGAHMHVGENEYVGMAAAWHEERSSWVADYELMRVLTGSCVLALSGLRPASPPLGDADMADMADTTDSTLMSDVI